MEALKIRTYEIGTSFHAERTQPSSRPPLAQKGGAWPGLMVNTAFLKPVLPWFSLSHVLGPVPEQQGRERRGAAGLCAGASARAVEPQSIPTATDRTAPGPECSEGSQEWVRAPWWLPLLVAVSGTMAAESSRWHGPASTPCHADTFLGTQLADERRPAICQPTGFGRQARPRLGLSWDATSLHTGVGELVSHPEE